MEKTKLVKAKVRRLAKRSRFWAAVLENLEKPSRKWRVVNIYHLNKVAPPGGKVLVMGKLLGAGVLEKRLDVVAFDFSEVAHRKIREAGGEALYLEEYLSKGGDGKGFILVG
ncbi:MAG: 50S ribosomal protein L18e [Nitrososphaerota archaeon]